MLSLYIVMRVLRGMAHATGNPVTGTWVERLNKLAGSNRCATTLHTITYLNFGLQLDIEHLTVSVRPAVAWYSATAKEASRHASENESNAPRRSDVQDLDWREHEPSWSRTQFLFAHLEFGFYFLFLLRRGECAFIVQSSSFPYLQTQINSN